MEDVCDLPTAMMDEEDPSRPLAMRRSTEPALSVTSPTPLTAIPVRPRTRSPYARSHLRTHSSTSLSPAPPMTRAQSSPNVDALSYLQITKHTRPSSPHFSPGRHQSPLRRPIEDGYSSFAGGLDVSETISENAELEIPARIITEPDGITPSSPFSIHQTFPRTRRRPSSPLYGILSSPQHGSSSSLRTSTSSPTLATKFNEAYPSSYSIPSSSMPSTPTSFRSRSPSMSSLETIPDSPDAEEAAQEADGIARLQEAPDGEAEVEKGGSGLRRGSLDVPGKGTGRILLGTNGCGPAYGSRDKRKRWSVCGAEVRGDLDLETIWED